MPTKTKKIGAIDRFIELPDAQKEKIWQEIDRLSPDELAARSQPLDRAERKRWAKFKRRGSAGRPKLGKHGVKVISLSVERELLDQADAYAKKNGLKRAELFTLALRGAIGGTRVRAAAK